MNGGNLVLAGGRGFIGGALLREFSRLGFPIVVLTRSPRPRSDGVLETRWDGVSAGPWTASLEGAAAVINLTGKNINCPHTAENIRQIVASRVDSINALGRAIAQCAHPPRVWVQAGAVGYYGNAGDSICDENFCAGDDVLAGVCREWESAFARVALPGTRKVLFRIGMVLGRNGGAFPVLRKLTRWFLGGAAGGGRQYVSWLHIADLAAMFAAAVAEPQLEGTFNAVAPAPVTNAQFMQAMRRAEHRPWSPPVPAFAIRLGARLAGSEGSLALAGQRCQPARFQRAGFAFRFPELPAAVADLRSTGA